MLPAGANPSTRVVAVAAGGGVPSDSASRVFGSAIPRSRDTREAARLSAASRDEAPGMAALTFETPRLRTGGRTVSEDMLVTRVLMMLSRGSNSSPPLGPPGAPLIFFSFFLFFESDVGVVRAFLLFFVFPVSKREMLGSKVLRCPAVSWHRSDGSDPVLTAGAASSRRIGVWRNLPESLSCVLANGRSVALANLRPPEPDGVAAATAAELDPVNPFRPVLASCLVSASHETHIREVIAVECLSPGVVASVDAAGTACIARLDSSSTFSAVSVVAPPTCCTEIGPTSLAWSGAETVARVRYFEHSLDAIDAAAGRVARHIRTIEQPIAATFVSPEVVAVAEGVSVCVYDLRQRSGPALQKRMDSVVASFRAIAHCPRRGPAVVLAGGDDRGIQALDTSLGGTIGRWAGCTKLSVNGIIPSTAAEASFCYVYGADSELTSGEWGNKRGRNPEGATLRVDSRWVGIQLQEAHDGDRLWGFTAAGSVYVIPRAHQLLRAANLPSTGDEGGQQGDD